MVQYQGIILFAIGTFCNGFIAPAPKGAEVMTQLYAGNANDLMPIRPGSTVALVTPFVEETGAVDQAGLRKLLKYHLDAGTDNLCILGTTGEAPVMSMDERDLILRTVVDEVKGKIPIIAGTGTINPIAVKAMTQHAMDVGCDAALVNCPYYVKPPQRCLIRHFVDTATVGLPVIIYNIPGRTGINMADESIVRAAMEHENIVALKDATSQLDRVQSVRRLLREEGSKKNFLLYSGEDATSVDFVLLGGDGCISVTANVAPTAVHDAMMAALKGDAETANHLNDKLMPLHKNLFIESNPMPAKWAVKRLGLIDSAFCRAPLDEMSHAHDAVLEESIKKAGLLLAVP